MTETLNIIETEDQEAENPSCIRWESQTDIFSVNNLLRRI